jgi:hypothetical protein
LATIAETPKSTDRMTRGAILGDHGVRGDMGGGIYAFNVLTIPWDIPDRACCVVMLSGLREVF